MRMSCQIAALNPMAEITNPARLIQSPTFIFIGSSAVIFEKGRATFTLFLGATTLGAERDLGARAMPFLSAISQPPISRTNGAATCLYMPSDYHLPAAAGRHSLGTKRESRPLVRTLSLSASILLTRA
ncbi:MAG TPA: hypothetical protein VLW50_25830 [Streptosporangiaceae bacterium]|nr:hypothetical protein [Streptosporangiaceae bacterium]